MKRPVDVLLDGVVWKQVSGEVVDQDDGIPYATHEGVLEVGGLSLRCYRLSDGRAVFNADDLEVFFIGLA